MADENLCLISYNSRGFGDSKREFVKSLTCLTGCQTIIFNQENFLLKSNGYIAKKALPEHRVFFKPASKEGLEGRPKNGMFVAVPLRFKDEAEEVPVTSTRLQCVILKVGSCRLLLINSYFPNDPRTDFDETELVTLLKEIETIIKQKSFDHVIIGGDINADFSRKTKFVNTVKDFLTGYEVEKSWDEYPVSFTHVMEKEGVTYSSTIDHFFWNRCFSDLVVDAGVISLPENTSDHCPIFCKFRVPSQTTNISKNNVVPRRMIPSWRYAKDDEKDEYFDRLTSGLEQLEIPVQTIHCRDVHCKDENHRKNLDLLMSNALSLVEDAAKKYLGKQGKMKKDPEKQKQKLPDWKEDVCPVKDTAHFWHAVWKSAGKPMNCHLHVIMKRTRNRYHLVIRRKKRLLQRMKRDNMLQSCINNDGSIFDAIKKQRKCEQTFPSMIDGHTEDIPGYLADKYEKLYNSVDDKENLRHLEFELEGLIDVNSLEFIDRISPDVVRSATQKKLKPGKTDPVVDITSDFLIHAPLQLFGILAACFKSYIIHAHVSNFLLISTMVPLLKDKLGDITSSNNYRSIAISSLVLKIFDLVILSTFSEYLQLDDLQFSYQSDVSTSMCTWLAVESVSHFLRNGNEVYTCLMDMSKAFDTVQHSQLFRKLLQQGLPAVIVRYILVSYTNQKANVRWNDEESGYFSIGNGVKQGAILSAILYCVYTNGIFQEMRQAKIGCFIGRNYVGILGYADDLYLLAPCIDGLQEMLSICEKYANDHNLKFSTDPNPNKSKTKCMAYLLKERELPKLELCGNKLPWVNRGKHLGMRIDSIKDSILAKDAVEKRARYIQSNNELVQEFAYTSSDTKAIINRIYNSHAYGAVLWDLYGKEAKMFYNSWSTSVRIMYRIDRKTHRYLIEPVSKMQHIKGAILKRFVGFTNKLAISCKNAVKNVYRVIENDCRTITGSNRRNAILECQCDSSTRIEKKDVDKLQFHNVPAGEEWRVQLVTELIGIRDGSLMSVGWSNNDIKDALEYICTS